MRKRERVNLMALVVLAILILGMTGCGATAPATTSVPSAPPRAAVSPSPSPIVAPATPRVPAAATTGWATYRAPHIAFQVPLPPGWHAGSFTVTNPGVPSQYIVQFFPPQTPVKPSLAATSMAPELIQITVVSAPPYSSVVGDPSWGAETSPVAIGTAQATLYDRGDPTGEEVLRTAELQQGALQFSFYLRVASDRASVAVDPAEVDRDTSLYLGMLRGFQLTAS